jgi:hypothetical protein
MKNCIKFKGENLECEDHTFENFDNPEKFNSEKFKSFIGEVFGNKNPKFAEKNSSPFVFSEDYVNQIDNNDFSLKPQQKFVGSYVNPHTNFNGCLVFHGLGSGKCHALDTPILMYDGSIKKVQDIKVGEKVMGDDSKSRNVMSLGRGKDDMYEVVPVKGETFTYNSEHILCLKSSDGGVSQRIDKRVKNQKRTWVVEYTNPETIKKTGKWFETKEEAEEFFQDIKDENHIFQIPIKDYIKLPKTTQSRLKLYRTGVEFRKKKIPFDPYIFGLWFGDGNSCSPTITNQDSAVIKYLKETLPIYNCYLEYHPSHAYKMTQLGDEKNIFREVLKDLNVLNNKHIPSVYKCNSREIRLQVLAGIIDSDGSYSNGNYEISQKKENMIDDIIYLSRSLGFACYKNVKKTSWTHNGIKKIGTAFRIMISGEISQIPVKIKRKMAHKREQKKNVLVTGFKVVRKYIDNYYGFTVDKNHMYLLGDFTITHNTCTSIIVGEAFKAYNNASIHDSVQKFKRIIVSAPAQVESQFVSSIKGFISKETHKNESCSAEVKIKDIPQAYLSKNNKIKVDLNEKELILSGYNKSNNEVVTERLDKFWNFISHQKFINGLYEPKEGKHNYILKLLQQPGNLIIIDEIQNLISEKGTLYSKFIKAIKFHMHPSNTLIVMSATPIYDKPYEIGLTLNLFKPRLFFPESEQEFDKLFRDKDTGEIINKNLFKWMSAGYVSYFRGGNPRLFPFKRSITVHHPFIDGSDQHNAYLSSLMSEVKMSDSEKKNDLFVTVLSSGKVIDNKIKDVSSFFANTQKFCNAYLPENSNEKNIKGAEKNKNTKKKLLELNKGKILQMKKNIEEAVEDVDEENRTEAILYYVKNNISVKYAYVIDKILKSPGTVFLYSNYLWYGVKTIAGILETLKFKEYNPVSKRKGLIKYIPKDIEKNPPRFVLWTGEIRSDKDIFSKNVKYNFNKNNIDGQRIKIVMGTQAVMEGISFQNVRDVHILNPWWNDSRIRQIEARAARFQSHDKLPEDQRYVNIYHHLASFPTFPKSFKKDVLKEKLEIKDDKGKQLWNYIKSRRLNRLTIEMYIAERSDIKKNNSREFEYMLKQASVDCDLNKYGNINRLNQIIEPYYANNKNEYVTYYENYSKGEIYIPSIENKETNKIKLILNYFPNDLFPEGVSFESDDKIILYKTKKENISLGGESEKYNVNSVYIMKPDRKDVLKYIPSNKNVSTITYDYIVNENIKCSVKNIDISELAKTNKQIKDLLELSKNIKIVYAVTSKLFDKKYRTGSVLKPKEKINFINIKKSLTNCIKEYIIGKPKKEREKLINKLQEITYSSQRISDIINDYKTFNKQLLGEYLFKGDKLLNIILNQVKNKPINMEELAKNTDKTIDELDEILKDVNEYLFSLSGKI